MLAWASAFLEAALILLGPMSSWTWCLAWREGLGRAPRASGLEGALLTVCSQTVRILLDVAAHVCGKYAGQAHTGGRVGTSWDRLAGFKSRHPDQIYPVVSDAARRGGTRDRRVSVRRRACRSRRRRARPRDIRRARAAPRCRGC